MEQGGRTIPPFEAAAEAFEQQMRLLPEVRAEFERLSGGSPGVANALLDVIAERSIDNPPDETTPESIRAIVGAPDDPEELDEWRGQFWKQRMDARTYPWRQGTSS